MDNKVIYITGPDGSGKTTILQSIKTFLIEQGEQVQHIWIRSPKILSKPLMLYCRLTGLTKYKTINGIRYGSHEFYRSSFVSHLFPIIQLIDFKINWYFVRYKIDIKHILLLDRFALDTLSDLMVDTRRFDLHKSKLGKAFIDLIPSKSKILLLKVDEMIIRKRKKDTEYDPNLNTKLKVYDILAEDLGIEVINNNKVRDIVKKEIFDRLGINERH